MALDESATRIGLGAALHSTRGQLLRHFGGAFTPIVFRCDANIRHSFLRDIAAGGRPVESPVYKLDAAHGRRDVSA